MQSGHRSRIILIGTSHKHAPIHIREKLSFSPDTLFGRLRSIRELCTSVEEVVILSTCNRTEIYVVSTDVEASSQWISRNLAEWSHISEPDLTAHLYRLVDEEAVRHLFHVTLGLDSMVVGESQIGAQVRESLKSAKQLGTAGRILSDLFQHALRASGDIRKQTGLATESTSVSQAAISLLKKTTHAIPLRGILLVGAGKMITLATEDLSSLGTRKVLVGNRTIQRAQELANRVGGKSLPLENIPEALIEIDAILSCISVPDYIVKVHDVEAAMRARNGRPLVMVDASVPRSIEPEAGHVSGVQLFNIDDLAPDIQASRAEALQTKIESASNLIEQEVQNFSSKIRTHDANATLKNLRELAEQIRETELERALRKMGRISEREKIMLDILTRRIVNKLLYEPTARLKEHAGKGEGETYDAVIRELFAIDQGGK